MKLQKMREIPDMIPREILVVDDEPEVLDVIKEDISRIEIDINVHAVSDGITAWKLVKEFPVIGVLFIDLHLPGGLDGITLGRMVKDRCPMMVVNAMTGFSDMFSLEECRRSGFDDYFAKPISKTVLQLAILGSFCKMERWRYGKVPPDMLSLIIHKMECSYGEY